MIDVTCANQLHTALIRYFNYRCIATLIVQQGRETKTDDIYIYHAYTLSLLLAYFQIKQRRGRLCFQEGEDDEDMDPPDTTIFGDEHVGQAPLDSKPRNQVRLDVNSNSNSDSEFGSGSADIKLIKRA